MTKSNVSVVLEVFRSVEQRDGARLLELCKPEAEFIWPPSLPYGGDGLRRLVDNGPVYAAAWDDLQTEAERQMDPHVVGSSEDEVVVLWHQRAVDRTGKCLDTPVLGRYVVREGKLAKAHMFHFDTIAVADFLRDAERPTPRGVRLPSPRG